MNIIVKKLLEYLLAWLMNPENIKKMVTWAIDFIDKKAKEEGVNMWDRLDAIIDTIIEVLDKIKAEKALKA